MTTLWGPLLHEGGATFRLWAPSSEGVTLEVEGLDPIPMKAMGEGWYAADAPARPGARYRFRTSPDLLVPDPASRAQAEDVHGASVLVDHGAYRWRDGDWRGRPWHETVLYELHVGACGGYNGVKALLPRLRDLGVTAVELMPLAAFPGGRNWGYDGVQPFAPDPSYGTVEELKALVDEAHSLGLSVFVDCVFNHFGPDGAYLHAYAKPFFDEGIHTPWGAAIDFKKPAVRAYFEECALMWLRDYHIDGLRLDAVHAISEQPWLDTLARRLRKEVTEREVHLVLENEGNTASKLTPGLYDAQWNDDGHNTLHPLLTGEREGYYEDFADDGAKKLARVLGEGFLFQGEEMPHLHRPRGEPSKHLPPTAFVLFLQNHDQVGNRAMGERLDALAPAEAMRAANALLLLCPQIPMLFMGEEWGATAPFLFFTGFRDPELAKAVREGRRKEFAHFKAFQDEEARKRIPDPNDPATFERSRPDFNEAERPPHDAILAHHRALLAIRHAEIIPRLKGAMAEGAEPAGPAAVVARWRMGDGSRLTIAANLGPEPAQVKAEGARVLFESVPGSAAALSHANLPEYTTVVLLDPA
ncbi:malto-oligosyltrehalose trehalohydrolase [Roseomonas sp. SSH11]|uniref:Malto-oligosyltrehalose trehalohydrolase n=1 Tax=Pararoseomonas baculiformis TaxID=2820812 RepID=A0ABS4A901_9PROT|nr:malto-oligosyltrehalose trehalohydrolase [Pararoseomonas baculiformis]MBP0443457.1 malto-oligosyltrehalose trehalohydrolase [Pararoseomonas baculiformis]